ncbi:MAG: PAS domain-containing protein [Pseudomonadota bacterium]
MKDDQGRSQQDAVKAKKIVTIQTPVPAYRATELAEFEAYWNSMRRDGDVPMRTDIDPRGIESLLSNAFVAEKIAPGMARMRIAGTHLCDVMGLEVRGMPVSSLIDPEDRDRLADALVELFERPATLRLSLSSKGPSRLAGTILLLPLRSDLGDISRALGCLVTHGAIGDTPRRFAITDCTVTPITSETSAPFIDVAEGSAFDADANVADVPPLPSERPYLRLVRS